MKTICFGILVTFCQPLGAQQEIDSFCQLYQRVIVDKGDGAIQATLGVKKRILANEQLYRRVCNGVGAKGN